MYFSTNGKNHFARESFKKRGNGCSEKQAQQEILNTDTIFFFIFLNNNNDKKMNEILPRTSSPTFEDKKDNQSNKPVSRWLKVKIVVSNSAHTS